jgi:predicted chitinase
MNKLKASAVIEIDDDFLEEITKRLAANRTSAEKKAIKFYTAKQIAKIVNRDVLTIRIYINNFVNGLDDKTQLKAIKKGKFWLISQENLDLYLNRKQL